MQKSDKVALLSSIILVGFAMGVIYHYILGFYLHFGEPFNTFVYPASMAFCDFTGILNYAKHLNPYHEVILWACYFPLDYIFLYPFSLIKNFVVSYSLYISIFFIFLIIANIKAFTCDNLTKLQNFQNIFILSVVSYPVLYMLDKGNLDSILFIILALFVYAFKSEKYFLAALLLGIENAFKPFPIFFLIFFLIKKRYKEFFASLLISALLVIGGFLFLKGSFFDQIIIFIKSLALFKIVYAYSPGVGIGFSSSLFMPLKAIMLHFSTKPSDLIAFIRMYDYFSIIITAVTLLFVWREEILWKQLTLLICNFLLLPYCTYDYKFIFLFIPIWLFVNAKVKSKFDFTYIILFALLFVPKSIIISLPGIHLQNPSWLSLSAIINPAIMLILTLLIIYEQFLPKKDNGV